MTLQTDPVEPEVTNVMRAAYLQLGLEPGASMREIETAYWGFARKLRGQSAMAPYSAAYEELVNSARPPANGARQAPAIPQEAAPAPEILDPRPPSKFGWPAA